MTTITSNNIRLFARLSVLPEFELQTYQMEELIFKNANKFLICLEKEEINEIKNFIYLCNEMLYDCCRNETITWKEAGRYWASLTKLWTKIVNRFNPDYSKKNKQLSRTTTLMQTEQTDQF